MEIVALIDRIKDEAYRLHHEEDLSLECAYDRALTSVVMQIAEQRVTPFQERILKTLRVLSPREDSPPVRIGRLMGEINSIETRYQAWYHLKALEKKGLVHRPNGEKSGWKAA